MRDAACRAPAVIALHLLRHAHAGDPAKWTGDDDARPLSEKGRRQAERLGRLLAATDEAPDLLITSPRARAAETAEIVARAVDARVVTDDRLAGSLDVGTVAAILRAAGPAERPCLVGHDPDFSELLGELLSLPAVPMRKGALARVDLLDGSVPGGRAVLRYLVPPEIVPGR
jgi:phosphohistidine phosphatase